MVDKNNPSVPTWLQLPAHGRLRLVDAVGPRADRVAQMASQPAVLRLELAERAADPPRDRRARPFARIAGLAHPAAKPVGRLQRVGDRAELVAGAVLARRVVRLPRVLDLRLQVLRARPVLLARPCVDDLAEIA